MCATLTVYPDPNVESTSVDGITTRSGVDEAMATIRAGAGTSATDSGAAGSGLALVASTTSNQFKQLNRPIFLFDTSALGAGATISAAVKSVFGSGTNGNGLSGEASANSVAVLVASTPASNTALVAGDYSQFGSTDFGRSAQQNAWNTAAYNDITLNASGLAAISKTGITKFALRHGWDFDNTITGLTHVNDAEQTLEMKFADTADVTSDPKLVITYTAVAGPANVKTYNGVTAANTKTIDGTAIASVKTKDGVS